MSDLKPIEPDESPKFYSNPVGGVQTSRLDGNANMYSTLLPVVKRVSLRFTPGGGGTITIPHNLKRRCDFFGRFQVSGDSEWQMIEQFDVNTLESLTVYDINDQNMVLEYFGLQSAPYDVEIYFVDFSI